MTAVTGSWEYTTAGGQAVTVERYEPGPDGRPKGYRRLPRGVEGPFLHYAHGRLPPDGAVIVTEGEKDCERLWSLGYAATTFNGGGLEWKSTDWSFLKGRDVTISPDRDDTGRRMCEGLAAHLLNGVSAARVSVVRVQKHWPEKSNACDLPESELRAALDDPEEVRIGTPVDWYAPDLTADVTMPEMQLPGTLEKGLPSVMFGQPSSGKSTLAILHAVALASGRGDIIGLGQLTPAHVGFVWCEEPWITLTAKTRALMSVHSIPESDIAGRITYLGDGDGNPWTGNLAVAEQIRPIRETAVRRGVQCLVIDSLSAAAPEAETKNDIAAITANGIVSICRDIGGSALLIHHSRKLPPGQAQAVGMEESRGASAVYGKARIVLQTEKTRSFLDDGETETVFRMHTVKANNFRTPEPRAFTVSGWHARDDIWVPYAKMIHPSEIRGPFTGIDRQAAVSAWRAVCDADPQNRRTDQTARMYAGKIAAPIMSIALTTKTGRDRMKAVFAAWVESGHLSVTTTRIRGEEKNIYERGDRNLSTHDD